DAGRGPERAPGEAEDLDHVRRSLASLVDEEARGAREHLERAHDVEDLRVGIGEHRDPARRRAGHARSRSVAPGDGGHAPRLALPRGWHNANDPTFSATRGTGTLRNTSASSPRAAGAPRAASSRRAGARPARPRADAASAPRRAAAARDRSGGRGAASSPGPP